MTSALRGALSSAIGLALVLAPLTASAYCRTTTTAIPASYSPSKGCFTDGLPLWWSNACVGYSVNSAGSAIVGFDDATRVIDASFAAWNAAVCPDSGAAVGITASNAGPVTCSEVRYNQNGPNQNVIVFRDDKWPYSDPNNTLGLTTVTFNSDTGEIYDADMEINASGKNLTTSVLVPPNGFDLLSVITHEAGHFLGLAHAMDANSTMYASYRPGTSTLRTLAPDDIAGICSIYPTADTRNVSTTIDASGVTKAAACDPTPRHGFGSDCEAAAQPLDSTTTTKSGCAVSGSASGGADVSSAVLALGTVALLVQSRRRKRQR